MSARAEHPKDFLSLDDWSGAALERILARSAQLKSMRRRSELPHPLAGRSVLLYFAKPSLRTFVTFQVGIVSNGM